MVLVISNILSVLEINKEISTVQKQQETLIVWSEGDNFDLALSFQEKVFNVYFEQMNVSSQYLYLRTIFILLLKAGCDEIWEKICSVQGKDPSVDFTQVLKLFRMNVNKKVKFGF